MNQQEASPTILVAPLDWGLGHATRCIPVIRELIRQGCRVVLAASGKGKALLQQEFPTLEILHLPGYDIKYASTAWGLKLKIVAQIPKLLSSIKKEHAWLRKVVASGEINAVIADNRYGLYHQSIPSVFITHQLCIKAPTKWAEAILQKLNYRFIHRFTACWVPDNEGRDNLAGKLSHPEKKPSIPVYYTGPLTRFENNNDISPQTFLLLLLSGPEPQRTLLEKKLLAEIINETRPVVIVRGLPQATETLAVPPHVTVFNHLPAAELQQKIREAALVVARSGYSTVMDLAVLRKKSILIPTPGQTEQEYLARHLMQRNVALCIVQKKFRLKQALQLAENFPYHFSTSYGNDLAPVVQSFVESLKKTKAAGRNKGAGFRS